MNKKLTKEECLKALSFIEDGTTEIEDFESIPCVTSNQFAQEISVLKQLINEHFELKEIIKNHGLENLTLHELDCAFKKLLGYVQENNQLKNLLIEFQTGEAYRELKKSYDELLGHAVAFQEELINLKDNPPLKFEELEVGMWVWDNLIKEYKKIYGKEIKYNEEWVEYRYDFVAFEENRFYRCQVKENE